MPPRLPIRETTSLLLALVILGWGAMQLLRERDRADWRRFLATAKGDELAARAGPPPTAAGRRDLARAYSRDFFPPRIDGARELLHSAVIAAPFRSGPWMDLARLEVLAGDETTARAALTRADSLDPHFLDQRLLSMQYWSLMGERGRTEQLARDLAKLGGSSRTAAMTELIRLGFAPTEIFGLFQASQGQAEEMAGFLGELLSSPDANYSAAQISELLDEIPESWIDTPAIREMMARFALSARREDVARRAWRLAFPETTRALVAAGSAAADASILVENLELLVTPFRDRFPLGWQPEAVPGWAEVRWESTRTLELRGIDAERGELTIELRDRASPNGGVLDWRFYRLMLPSDLGATVSLVIRVDPAGESRCRLDAVIDGKRIPSLPTTGEPGNEQLRVTIPPQPTDAGVELVLVRDRTRDFMSEATRIRIVSLEITPLAAGDSAGPSAMGAVR